MYNSERFIMNSDALSFAQSGSASAIITRPTITTSDQNEGGSGTIKATIPSVNGAVPVYTISYEAMVLDENFQPKRQQISFPSMGTFTINDVYADPLVYTTYFSIRRVDNEKIAIDYYIPRSKPNTTYPAMTFTLEVKYLYPPNI